jgi:hypothetical protein
MGLNKCTKSECQREQKRWPLTAEEDHKEEVALHVHYRIGGTRRRTAAINQENEQDDDRHEERQPNHAQQPGRRESLNSEAFGRSQSSEEQIPHIEDWLEEGDHLAKYSRTVANSAGSFQNTRGKGRHPGR